MHVVTGASSGIGRGVALGLATRGETVLAVARRSHLLEELAASAPKHLRPLPADVTSEAGIGEIVQACDSGPVQSIVHSAGSLVKLVPWTDLPPEELISHLAVHVAAPIALTGALARASQVERMVFIDSYSATTPRHGWSAYSIVKSAAQMSARSARQELPNTRVVRVFPGAVDTPLLDLVLESRIEAADTYLRLKEEGKVSSPESIGRQIADLVLDTPDELLESQEVWTVGYPA